MRLKLAGAYRPNGNRVVVPWRARPVGQLSCAGERLFSIAARMPDWIADTPRNRSAVEQHRARHPGQSGTEGVTTFKVDPNATSEDWCAQVLTNVDLHHGRYSHNPPYSVVEVFGATLTPTLRTALGDLGFHLFTARDDGFRATSSDAAA